MKMKSWMADGHRDEDYADDDDNLNAEERINIYFQIPKIVSDKIKGLIDILLVGFVVLLWEWYIVQLIVVSCQVVCPARGGRSNRLKHLGGPKFHWVGQDDCCSKQSLKRARWILSVWSRLAHACLQKRRVWRSSVFKTGPHHLDDRPLEWFLIDFTWLSSRSGGRAEGTVANWELLAYNRHNSLLIGYK